MGPISKDLCCPGLLNKSTRDNHVSQYGYASHGPNPERSSHEHVYRPDCLRRLFPRVGVRALPSRAPRRNVWAEADMADWKPLVYHLEFSLPRRLLCGFDDHREIYVRGWSLCWSYGMCTMPPGHRQNRQLTSRQLTGPVLADMFLAKDRGKSLAIAGLLPYLGPALGPIIGGLAAERLWWPWLFWILSAFDALVLVLGFFIIRESYTPVLLRRKAEARAEHTAHDGAPKKSVAARIGVFYRDLSSRIGPAMKRPIRLLTHRPIIQLIALAMAVDFGVYTLVLSTFASLWINQYHQNETDASLHYIAIALGAFVCAQAGGRLMDLMWHRMKAARPDREPTPEWRVPYIIVGLVPCVAGTFWYAWSAERRVHWAVVDVGVFFFTVGNFMFSQGLLAYNVDEFTSTRAASASAATRLGTYLLGFVFPIFAPKLYENLGYGWGNSLLGFLYAVMSIVIIAVLWIWGEKIRAIGRTAEEEREKVLQK